MFLFGQIGLKLAKFNKLVSMATRGTWKTSDTNFDGFVPRYIYGKSFIEIGDMSFPRLFGAYK